MIPQRALSHSQFDNHEIYNLDRYLNHLGLAMEYVSTMRIAITTLTGPADAYARVFTSRSVRSGVCCLGCFGPFVSSPRLMRRQERR
jgi:hypothetical protein